MGNQANPLLRHSSTPHGMLMANVTLSRRRRRSTSSAYGWEVVLADQETADL